MIEGVRVVCPAQRARVLIEFVHGRIKCTESAGVGNAIHMSIGCRKGGDLARQACSRDVQVQHFGGASGCR